MTASRHAHWAGAIEGRAVDYWTAARTDELLRGKQVAVRPREGAVLLRALGILDGDARLPPQRVGKFFQVNHMIGAVEPTLAELRERPGPVRIVDAGCGRSYLTTALAWCGAQVWQRDVHVLGIDRNPDVVAESRRRVELCGLGDRVKFVAAPVDTVDAMAAWRTAFAEEPTAIAAVIGLHACDTATCDAIVLGVRLAATLVAVAPCCQAELARAWAALADRQQDGALAPLWGSPHLRRETAGHVTDLMRMLLLRAHGYRVTALEFVPHEHTRKNTLLRAAT